MEVITIETAAFWRLIQEAIQRCQAPEEKEPWVSEQEAKELLNIKSKTTLYKLRINGSIKYSEVTSRNFLYCRKSILDFIESKSKHQF
ncbi:MAG: DNA-binding protein [Bacteroidota bacterium]